jgi:hypothetical protein
MRLIAIVGMTLSLGACATDIPVTAPQAPPPNYGRLAIDYFTGSRPKLSTNGALVGPIGPAVAPQPGEWFTCLKLASGDYYAVFYADGKVSDARPALVVDRCAQAEGYAPIPAPAPPPAASKSRKKP